MARFTCFPALLGKKKSKSESHRQFEAKNRNRTLKVKVDDALNAESKASFDVAVPFEIQVRSTYKVKVLKEENSVAPEPLETAYEGEDEHDCENSSMKRDFSDFDLQAQCEENRLSVEKTPQSHASDLSSSANRLEQEEGTEMMQSGHVSDPGIGKASAWGSPKLKRSCSNVETRRVFKKIGDGLPLSKSQSFEDVEHLARGSFIKGILGSPVSVMTSCSADRVMLKRRSSSQVLPSRSRKLWWKLFLWSHRNLHRPVKNQRQVAIRKSSNQRDGYSSDTVEVGMALSAMKGKAIGSHKMESPCSSFGEAKRDNWDKFQGSTCGYWPRNQWVAFYSESSPLARVDEWVNTLETQSALPPDDNDDSREAETEENIFYPPSPEKQTTPTRRSNLIAAEDMLEANSVIQSLNSLSTVAHISGMGLKVIPHIAPFTSLRTVNLSGNFIVCITPGCLPKSLHTLNLSRNKIAAIEGLRELTRLRVLDLSYNRISRIGHGLSNCTVIKELYLAGNKISDVEGLHRLLKLTVLDLSFNRITTTKALGQLVANYNSLLALNLLGNPIQSNLGDDQLRKAVSSLLPQLAYLNKQPIKPHRAREAVANSVAKAALGNSGWSARRKPVKRVTQLAPSAKGRTSERGGHRVRHKSGSSHHRSPSTRR
ncbi:hypothetical protein H6P81_011446 [Aristolochia fimbriata]|uniref:Uncharacterized protein n=1 Tax=Aristolochia fimbriata TaxID=158543 RepID=A0AAV7EUG0_ARIFI|nr:hypothetical protein H6P81_011446 [Aristolochia fimbriata]